MMPPPLPVPSEKDWGDYQGDLDQEYAHRIFHGKTREETIPLFERNVIERCSELRFMPVIPFQYYLLALCDYVLSPRVLENDMAPDAGNCFLELVMEKLTDSPDAISPLMGEILPAVEYIALNQSRFDADIDIYGDFRQKLAEIRGLYARKTSGRPSGSD